jgi:2-keto-4-pentenoate hydratase/2-oxohepta-3-ene-1,7-dioic acid hydratase in catechol pathway
VIPPGTEDVHFEAELVIVIGKRAKDVPKENAQEYIPRCHLRERRSAPATGRKAISSGGAQKARTPFAPCGPFIVSGIRYDDLAIELRLNGEVKQKERTSDLLHNTSTIVSWISRHVTLEPGDLIYTGTPARRRP